MAPDFTLADQDGNEVEWQGGHALFLPKGRHARLHDAGVRRARSSRRVRRCRCGRAGDLTGPGREGEEIPRKASPNFALLADEGHGVADSYGVWVEKSMYGLFT
jgi:hypothetical protein